MLDYLHVDVFTKQIMNGNGLTIVFDNKKVLSNTQMQSISQEFKQFETIFLQKKNPKKFFGRVFTVEEELDFAGHPILGAVASIHELYFKRINKVEIELILNSKTVIALSERNNDSYYVEMNQGAPEYLGIVPKEENRHILKHLNLQITNLYQALPIEIISTGLPYLLIPLESGLDRAKIITQEFEKVLYKYRAKFVYIFDVNSLECRTWDNQGKVEDVATGSAAGPLCAYLVKHKIKTPDTFFEIYQGKYVKRPSVIRTKFNTNLDSDPGIIVAGNATIFATGSINL